MAWGRIVQLTVGTPGQPGVVLSGLYMTFEVQKSKGGEAPANAATIKIYNQSEASFKAYVSTATAQGASASSLTSISPTKYVSASSQNPTARLTRAVILQAGYADELNGAQPPTLFVGQIKKATRHREGADWITEIISFAGLSEIRNANLTISYAPGSTPYQILSDIATYLGCQITGLSLVPLPITYPNGYSYSGPAGGALKEITDYIGFDWWASSDTPAPFGEIILAPKGPAPAPISAPAYVLSQATGLLLPPEMEDATDQFANADQIPDDVNATQRWKFTCLLYPQIQPGTIVQVDSPNLPGGTGYFDPVICTYHGDSREGDFKIEIEAYNVTPGAAA
jgi:hypothetical protein